MIEKVYVKDFEDWIENARTGQVFKYHTGFLAVDRGTIVDHGDGVWSVLPCGDIDAIGKLAVAGFDAGKLHLFQRKIHDGVYEYIAMKKSRYGRNW